MQSDFSAGTVISGELVPTVSVWTRLVPKSAASKCSRVRVNTPGDSPANVASFLIVISTAGAAPTNTHGAFELPKTATGLNYLWYGDASWIWVLSQNAGDRIEFSIES